MRLAADISPPVRLNVPPSRTTSPAQHRPSSPPPPPRDPHLFPESKDTWGQAQVRGKTTSGSIFTTSTTGDSAAATPASTLNGVAAERKRKEYSCQVCGRVMTSTGHTQFHGGRDTALTPQDRCHKISGWHRRELRQQPEQLSSNLGTHVRVPLLKEEMTQIWEQQRRHIPCLQDPPNVCLYTITGHNTKGGVELPLLRCTQGSTYHGKEILFISCFL